MSKTYIICATQRSGSTLLVNDFNNAGLGNPEEHYLGFLNNKNFLYTQKNIKKYLSQLHKKATANDITSIKIMSNQVRKINTLLNFKKQKSNLIWGSFYEYYKQATWVFISRGDLVAQAKSQLLASHTNVNHLQSQPIVNFTPGNMINNDNSYLDKTKSLEFNSQNYKSLIIKIAKENARWEVFYNIHKIKPIRIFYENIIDDADYLNIFKDGIDTKKIFKLRSLQKLNKSYLSNGLLKFINPIKTLEAKKVVNSPDIDVEKINKVARRWANTNYYNNVNSNGENQWNNLILPFLEPHKPDMRHVLDLAVGHGRMTEIFLKNSKQISAVDVLQENIDFCHQRFGDNPKLRLIKNNGVDLSNIDNESITFVFCFDSMIHFDSDVVRNYLKEFHRIMAPGALAFLHHSNLTRNPGGDFQKSAHARNFMSVPLFSHYAQKEGLFVIKQKIIDWGMGKKKMKDHDGLSLLEKK